VNIQKISKKFKFQNIYYLFFVLLTNYFIFHYIFSKAVRVPRFIDEYISLTSNLNFFKNLDFNAGEFIGGSYSIYLTSGPLSAVGSVIGWNLTNKIILSRIFNIYWLIILQFLLSILIYKVYKVDKKHLLMTNFLFIFLIPWWQGGLYSLGEISSMILFSNSIFLFTRFRKTALFLFGFSIFFGKLLTLLPFLGFYMFVIFNEKKLKNIFSDFVTFLIPLIMWLFLINIFYEGGNLVDYINSQLNLILNHQSSGAGIQNEYSISNQISSSEISLWNIFDIFRVGIIPLLYISLLLITKKKILEKNSYFSFYGVIFSIIPTYLWFWLMSPTKWIRYSQHFTILVVISSLYLITMNLDFSRIEKTFLFLIPASYIENTIFFILFIITIIYFIFLQDDYFNNISLIYLLYFFISLSIISSYFQTGTSGDINLMIDNCYENTISDECRNSYMEE